MSDFVCELLTARAKPGKATHVFPADSVSGHIESARHFFNLVAADCGIKISPHDLRRTFITHAEACDLSFLSLKALVNHSTKRDVTSGYVQQSTDRLSGPAQRVADRLKELCGITATPMAMSA